jgi:hypothetical protein
LQQTQPPQQLLLPLQQPAAVLVPQLMAVACLVRLLVRLTWRWLMQQ